MNIKLFSDLIDALGKVTSALKAATSLPKVERDQYRLVVGQNYQLLDTTLSMIVIRLGDILAPENEAKFLDEVAKLDNIPDWVRVEREFRLCLSLRAALSEIKRFSGKLKALVSIGEIDALIQMMEGTTAVEGEVAEFIGAHFHDLSSAARAPEVNVSKLLEEVRAFREVLMNERKKLIRDESELYSIV